MLEHISRSALL